MLVAQTKVAASQVIRVVKGRRTSEGRARGCLLPRMQAVREGKALQVWGQHSVSIKLLSSDSEGRMWVEKVGTGEEVGVQKLDWDNHILKCLLDTHMEL